MAQDKYIADMMTEKELETGPSEVARFYSGCNVLLTGGSGFLGRLLIDKILRSCPNINTLFLLLRAKQGKTPEERFKELFDDVIFARLHKEKPGFARKVVLIEGDMVQIGLGLSPEQRTLLRNTHIVIHGAATVRFDEQMRIATNINVRGTKELLLFAQEMPELKAFVHISTAFSNYACEVIDEKFYDPPIETDKLLDLLGILDDATLDHMTPVLLGKWPNTYAFTKAVGEDTVRRYRHNLPVCIVRPSIVMATFKEPVAGWINNVYGPTGVIVGAAVGLLRTLYCDESMIADLIPADYVVSNVIVAAWDAGKARTDSTTKPGIEDPIIYNAVSSCQRPITWGQLLNYTTLFWMEVPSVTALWYLCFRLNKNPWVHKLFVIFLHLFPAAILDSLAWLTGRKPKLWKAYKKIHKFSAVISYFTLRQWKFYDNNVQDLWKRMSPVDRNEFDLDIRSLDWKDFSYSHARGFRNYLLKDPLNTVAQGRAKYAKLKVAHYTVVTVVCGLLLWLLWTCLRFIFSR